MKHDNYMIVGRPLFSIPDEVLRYPDFLTWWNDVGRLRPNESHGWITISGPGVMWGRTEMIPTEAWDSVPESEKELIRQWVQNLRNGILYD